MEATKSKLRGAIILAFSLSLLAMIIGCSNDAPFSVDNSSIDIPPPPLTAENIAKGPAPGYSYVELDVSEMFNGITVDHPMVTSQMVYDDIGGSVYFLSNFISLEPLDWWHGVVIDADDIHEDLRVEMIAPNPMFAVIDLAPHPYQFDSEIQIEMSYRFSIFSAVGISPDNLVMMWWNPTIGEYVEINSQLNSREGKLIGITDHFSRYIIANGGGD